MAAKKRIGRRKFIDADGVRSDTYPREFEPTTAYRNILSIETRKRLIEFEKKTKESHK